MTEFENLRTRAEAGDAEAQCNLGLNYANGQGGAQDDAEALRWYRLAADQGYARAQNNLGFMYRAGRGVLQDYAEAERWYCLAAEQGDTRRQILLAEFYRRGEWVKQDYVQAYKWANLAAHNAIEKPQKFEATAVRDIVAGHLSVEERREAQELARQFLEGGPRILEGGLRTKLEPPKQPDPPVRRTPLKKDRISVWRRDEGRCVECGSKENLEYDHIIPVSKGGSNTERNIQLLCESCNRSKGASI